MGGEDDGWALRALGFVLLWLLLVLAVGALWTLSTVRAHCEGAGLDACARSFRLSSRPATVGMLLVGIFGAIVIAVAVGVTSARSGRAPDAP